MRRESLIERLRDFFRSRPGGLTAVYLYGSQARDRASETSDVDLGVLFAQQPPAILGGPPDRLANELEADLRLPIEIVTLNDAPADLIHRVLRDGILVYEGDRSSRIRFEVAKRRQYFDLLPILREYRRPGRPESSLT